MHRLNGNLVKTGVKERLFRYRHIDERGCWVWMAAKINSGYGVIGIRNVTSGLSRNKLVHRVSAWIFKRFDIVSNLLILHRCDNKLCFNPEHLFIGTQQDNIDDMWAKGRGPNQHHPRKLTQSKVRRIRRMYHSGRWTNRSLGSHLGLGKSTIQAIVTRKIWNHVP